MKRFLLFILLTSFILSAQNKRVLLDENFSDWDNIQTGFTDTANDKGSGNLDIKSVKVYNDDKYVFFMIETAEKYNLTNENYITLNIDLDNNSSTGQSINGIGADLVYNFGTRAGTYSASTLDLVVSPTVSSDKFEIGLKRDFGSGKFGSKIKFCFNNGVSGDKAPDNIGYEYDLISGEFEGLPPFSIEKQAGTVFRIATYNVLNDGIVDAGKKQNFKRILSAIDADIYAFQEVVGSSADLIKTTLKDLTGKDYYTSKIGYDLVLASKYEITQSETIYTYVASSHTKTLAIHKINVNGKDIVVLNCHPKCCSGTGNDLVREVEFDLMMKYIRDSKDGKTKFSIAKNTPIIILGDMNLVGNDIQQNTLLTGDIVDNNSYGADFNPDWDGTALKDSKPLVVNQPLAYTKYATSYPSSRLDYIVYTDSKLEVVNSYVLETKYLSTEQKSKFNFTENDTEDASDHLPVVTDFKYPSHVSVFDKEQIPNSFMLHQNYPNPFNPETKISFELSDKGNVKLNIYNSLGEKLKSLIDKQLEAGSYSVKFEAGNYPSGVYYYKLAFKDQSETKKMILLK